MKTNPLISVVIPAYNSECSIKRCILSVLFQSYNNIEVLLVNDGSTDNTSSICHHLADQDSRIMVFDIQNSGSAAARNYALNRISGDFVTFIDSDDYVDSGMLQGLLSYMDERTVVRSLGIDELPDGTLVKPRSIIDSPLLVPSKEMSFTGPELYGPVVWGALFPRDVIDPVRFPTDYSVGEDSIFLSRACHNASYIKVIPDRWYHYVLNSKSITHAVYGEKRYSEILAWEKLVSESSYNSSTESSARSALCVRALTGLVEVSSCKSSHQVDYVSKLRLVAKDNLPFLLRDSHFTLRRKVSKLIEYFFPIVYSRLFNR